MIVVRKSAICHLQSSSTYC